MDSLEDILDSFRRKRRHGSSHYEDYHRHGQQHDKYLITVAADGQISWQAHAKVNRVIGGQCTVRSGVLFIGTEEQENAKTNRADFFAKLATLPRWDGTKIWSTGLVLRPCQAQP